MSRSYKLDRETREESFKVHHSGNNRKQLAEEKDKLRRARKRSLRQFNERELNQEYGT